MCVPWLFGLLSQLGQRGAIRGHICKHANSLPSSQPCSIDHACRWSKKVYWRLQILRQLRTKVFQHSR